MDIWVISIFWPWWIMLLWARVWQIPVQVPLSTLVLCTQKWMNHVAIIFSVFAGTTILFPQQLHHFTLPSAWYKELDTTERLNHDSSQHRRSVPISPLLGQHLLFSGTFVFVFIVAFLMVLTRYLIVFLVCVFLMICEVDHLFSYTYWPCVYLSREIPVQALCPFLNWVILLLLIFRSSSYTLGINPSSGTWCVNIFSH